MKIVFLGRYNQTEILTGPEKVAKRLFDEMSKQYNSCLFIEYFFKRDRNSNWRLRLFGKEVVSESVLRLGIARLCFFLLTYQPDTIHIITIERFVLPVFFYKMFLKGKIVTTMHGVIKHELQLSQQRKTLWGKTKDLALEYFIVRLADHIVFVSEVQLSLARTYYRINPDKIHIIPNGIDECFTSKREKEFTPEGLNIVIRDRSGFDIDGVNAVKNLLAQCKNVSVSLFIINDKGTQRDETVAASDKSVTHRVRFTPPMNSEQLVRFLIDKHILINAARYDTFSLFTVECMAAGLVPIVADTVGMKSYIKHGENGFIYPRGNPESINGILELISSGEFDFRKLSERARKIYEELNWRTIAAQYNKICLT